MFKNYLKIAFRTLKRSKVYAFINVFGLALGIACCVLLFLYVHSEWTHDHFHEKGDRIFRVNRVTTEPGGDLTRTAGMPAPLAPALEASFPEVQEVVRLSGGTVRIAMSEGEDAYVEVDALFADSTFFRVFTFPLLKGNPQTALAEPNAVVLTRSATQKYFGEKNPMGELLSLKIEDETLELRVTGVVEDPATNSSIEFDVLLPLQTKKYDVSEFMRGMIFSSWEIPFFGTFVLLQNGAQADRLEAKLPSFTARHFNEEPQSLTGEDGEEVQVFGPETTQLRLQPLTDIHLRPEISPAALAPPSNPLYSYLMAGVALLVLLIACINFATLALGRSASRAKEVGVRKVVGAHRGQIRRQFWSEAILTSGAALLVGLLLTRVFLPVFNELAGTELSLHLTPVVLPFLLGLVILIGLLAGSYPALVLSRFEPARILSGNAILGGGRRLTRALVVVQFTLSIAFVAGTLIMSSQLRYMQTDLGFNQEQVVVIEGLGSTTEGQKIYEPFRLEALRHEAVQSVAGASFGFFGAGLDTPLAPDDTTRLQARAIPINETFMETLQIGMLEGRDFSTTRAADAYNVLVNEALVRAMGWTSAVGKELPLPGGSLLSRIAGEVRVIGVTENFHARALHSEIAQLMLIPSDNFGGVSTLYVRIAPEGISQTLSFLRETWQEVAPDRPFQYQFLDKVVAQAYENEQRWRAIVRYAGGFALLIACFGLFGLTALAAERRTKEIGIRKVLGASVTNITVLLSRDFLKLVGLAFIIAAPLAYLGAQWWLEQFAYRIELGLWFFAGAGGIVLVIALLAVSYQAIRAASADPVEALRSE